MKLPAILCVLAQWRATLAEDCDPAPSRWYQRHLTRCPRCQHARAELTRLERRLRATAPATRRTPSPQWFPRLEARLRAERLPPSRPAPTALKWLKPAAAWGVVGLVGTAAWLLLRPTPPPVTENHQVVISAPALPVLSSALEADPLTALAARLSDPLQTELDRMLTELRKVGHSFAASFLPESLPATPPSEER